MRTEHSAEQERLTVSKNERTIWYDPRDSHVATHFEDTPQLKGLVQEVLSRTVLVGESINFERDLGKIVGLSDLVATDETDQIFYAKRQNRDSYTVFTKSRRPEPSSLVTVTLWELPDMSYELVTAFIGTCLFPPFPDNPLATPQSKPFWSTHALAWGRQKIQPGTETTECPW